MSRKKCMKPSKEVIRWLEGHEEKMPRTSIYKDERVLTRREMTDAEVEEVRLGDRWKKCPERKILKKYIGRPIEEVPEEYREDIARLRELGQGIMVLDKVIKWAEENEGRKMRGIICKDGNALTRNEMTEKERVETNLYSELSKFLGKKNLRKYAGRPIEEVPEEYREKIARLRELGQLRTKKDDKIETRMKRAVSKHVGENEKTRQELEGKQERDIESMQEDRIK